MLEIKIAPKESLNYKLLKMLNEQLNTVGTVFAILKVLDLIDWPWVYVLWPYIAMLAVVFTYIAVELIFLFWSRK